MKNIFFTLLAVPTLVCTLGCRGAVENAAVDDVTGLEVQEKPVNGVLTLKTESLALDSVAGAKNVIERNLTKDTQVIIKEYAFTPPDRSKRYTVSVVNFDTSNCSSISDPVFVIREDTTTSIQSPSGVATPLPLNPTSTFRLRFYVDHVKCTTFKVSFTVHEQ